MNNDCDSMYGAHCRVRTAHQPFSLCFSLNDGRIKGMINDCDRNPMATISLWRNKLHCLITS